MHLVACSVQVHRRRQAHLEALAAGFGQHGQAGRGVDLRERLRQGLLGQVVVAEQVLLPQLRRAPLGQPRTPARKVADQASHVLSLGVSCMPSPISSWSEATAYSRRNIQRHDCTLTD